MAPSGDALRCPRCGYDQRGVVATWREQCPLEGTCAECGLTFEWRELLNLNLLPPQWCVEASRPWWAFTAQALGTTARLAWPDLVWRRVRMVHDVRWLRLSTFVVFWAALIVLSVMLSTGLSAAAQWRSMASSGNFVPPRNAWVAFWRASTQPLSSTPSTFVWSPPAGAVNVSGGTVLRAATFTVRGASPRSLLFKQLEAVGGPVSLLLATPACCALAFAALPISRRRSKVRWSHIARVTIYCYGMVLPLALLIVLSYATIDMNRIVMVGMVAVTGLLLLLFLPWLLVFWLGAVGEYLRMQHRWAVALSVVLIGCFLPIAVSGAIWARMPVR